MNPSEQTIPPYLLTDRLHHIDMIEAIRRNKAAIVHQSSEGVLLFHEGCGAYMLSARTAEFSEYLIALMDKPEFLVVHQDFSRDQILHQYSFNESMGCFHSAYFGDSFPPDLSHPFSIIPLDATSIDIVMKHYRHIDDREYLLERLGSGWFHGAFLKGKLTGFVGVHGEGSIGMLQVLPEYRRIGVAQALLSFVCNRFISQKMIPFAQIITENTASISLFSKLGFAIAQTPIWWLM